MAGAFQANAFQNNSFQVAAAAAATTTGMGSGGSWVWDSRAKKLKPWRKPGDEDTSAQRIRRLSELDPVFTPEEVLDVGPQQLNVDEDTLRAMAMDEVAKLNEELGRRQRAMLLKAIEDDEENFLVM